MLVPINELVGIKTNKRYQRIRLKPETLNRADLTDLPDRVRLTFIVSQMIYSEITRHGIMFTVAARVSMPFRPQTRQERGVHHLFSSALLNAIRLVNVEELKLVDQPIPMISDGTRSGSHRSDFDLVFVEPISGPQALKALRRVLEAGYAQARALLSKAGEISSTLILPNF